MDVMNIDKTGVSCWKSSTGTIDAPLFETDADIEPKEEITFEDEVIMSDGWTDCALAANIAPKTNHNAYAGIGVKKEGEHVFLSASLSFQPKSGSVVPLSTTGAIPEALRPSGIVAGWFTVESGSSSRIIQVEVDSSGTVSCVRMVQFGSTSFSEAKVTGCDILLQWFID